jgi:hypothetical protein
MLIHALSRRIRHVAKELHLLVAALFVSTASHAANHREAPITALDHKADITDLYAFRSYDGGSTPKVTMIVGVDPLLEPANGPNYFPFDPDILYEIKVDNNHDAVEDIGFQFRFTTEQRLPTLFQGYAGISGGAVAPANSPAPVPPGTALVPDRIDSFESAGLGTRQTYTLTMVRYERRPRGVAHRHRLRSVRRAGQYRPAHHGLRSAVQCRDLHAGQ